MARLKSIHIQNYRSIQETAAKFPRQCPLVLVGENNAGKSNIVKALQLILGPFWPGNHEPEDHEFYGRDRAAEIEIDVRFADADPLGGRYTKVVWRYDGSGEPPVFFKGTDASDREGYVRNDDRDSCTCVVVEADRNLNYQLGYSSKWTLLSRLMTRFHRALEQQKDVRAGLEELFKQVKEKFHEIPEFSTFVTGLQEQMNDLVSSMSHRLEVDFEAYDPTKFFHALRLQAVEGEVARTLDEMGTGEQQVLAMAFAHAYAKAFHGGILLIIEEPESHLHPLAQQWLAQRLAAMMTDGVQVVMTTHSAAFLDIMNLEGIALVRKDEGGTFVTQITKAELVEKCIELGADAKKTSKTNVLPFYRANASHEILEGFFAKAVLLVEGPSEVLALPVYLEKVGLNCAKEGLAVVPVYGKGNFAKWRRLFSAYDIPCYVIFDNDAEDDKKGAKRADALKAVGVTASKKIAELLEADDWVVEDEYAIFGEDFESHLRATFMGYSDLEEEVRGEGIDSKPFVARAVAERIELGDDDGRSWLTALADKLRSKIPAKKGATQAEEEEDEDEIPF